MSKAVCCCSPTRSDEAPRPDPTEWNRASGDRGRSTAVRVPGGPALLGTDAPFLPADGEGPLELIQIESFLLDPFAVTNAQFGQFTELSGYVTDAERYGWSFVFSNEEPLASELCDVVKGAPWWRRVYGAKWDKPSGPLASQPPPPDHPVVHVSWRDATAYASWARGRLPTEVEWEHAARGGLGDVRFPWGNEEPNDSDLFPCNIWQGSFPTADTAGDGFAGTAPVGSYRPNGYGLYNMCGNAWEWVSGAGRSASRPAALPRGIQLLKGGSYLCHRSYCYRYRIAARSRSSEDSSTCHQGFRVAYDLI